MNTGFVPELEEKRRNALVAYYLGQVAPVSTVTAPLNLTTPEDLYQYLLIDNQVSATPDTSRVAQGIASLQQYIHSLFNGMEPGYPDQFSEAQRRLWQDSLSQYSTWAGYQKLNDYPENYIDPELRIGETQLFNELKMELGQARINEDTVQKALLNYLGKFEPLSNLKVIAGYINGNDFKNADYYFVGRQTVPPFQHYWRKASIELNEDSYQVNPASWSEWKSIDASIGETVRHVRTVVLNSRPYLVWIEPGQPVIAVGEPGPGEKRFYHYSAKMAYKLLNDTWSPPMEIYKGVSSAQTFSNALFSLHVTVDLRQAQPRLVVYFKAKTDPTNAPTDMGDFLAVYDPAFNPVALPTEEISLLKSICFQMFGNDDDRLQFPLSGRDSGTGENYETPLVIWDQASPENYQPAYPIVGINQYLQLNVNLRSDSSTEGYLELQGVCTANPTSNLLPFLALSSRPYHDPALPHTSLLFKLNSTDEGFQASIQACSFSDEPTRLPEGTWYQGDVPLATVTLEDYRHGLAEAGQILSLYEQTLDIDLAALQSLSSKAIRRGGGFRFVRTNGDVIELNAPKNRYRQHRIPLEVEFQLLYISDRTVEEVWRGFLKLNGDARTPITQYPGNGAVLLGSGPFHFTFGTVHKLSTAAHGINKFDVTIVTSPRLSPRIVRTRLGAEFLDLRIVEGQYVTYVRLNSQFVSTLVHQAELSAQSALDWERQHLTEPPTPEWNENDQWPALDFNGANGRYLWELFFHTPHLVAHRLHTEFDYRAAQHWYHNLFNPLERLRPLHPPAPDELPYWACRPLLGYDEDSYEVAGPNNPDAIAYSRPSHYRKVIFTAYVKNIIAHGDMLYRQLTRETLNEAKLLYVRALSLLGPLSKGRSISQWTPISLEEAAAHDSSVMLDFESSVTRALQAVTPASTDEQPWFRLIDAPWFRLPFNQDLLTLWDTLDLRLSNLRHHLSLDGKPLNLALFEAPANPQDLLRAQATGSGSGQRRLGSLPIIAPYRLRAMLPRVQNAVETLMRFGDQVRNYMELRDRADQEELIQNHVLELSKFTVDLQEEAIQQAKKSLDSLTESHKLAAGRQRYYEEQLSADVSNYEKSIASNRDLALRFSLAASTTIAIGTFTTLSPNIFGMTFGGMNYAAPFHGTGELLQATASEFLTYADRAALTDHQNRRRDEWSFQRAQAEAEQTVITRQIEAQEHAIAAAVKGKEQADAAQQQAQAYFDFLKKRATSPELYRWLLSQVSTLYFQAYDLVLSLCLSTEACWQYEMGDFDTHFIPTSAWADNRFGLTAGESLKLALLRLETAYLNRHERRLELNKTVSLRQLFKASTPERWESEVLAKLRGNGELEIALKPSLFDKDYPGHYLRQLVSVSLSLPVLVGPYQDIHATLVQQRSSTLLKPTFAGVQHLYKQAGESEEEDTVAVDISYNPRPYQQAGFSSGVNDSGLFVLDFGDERYLPFEGTGAISDWLLSFPRHQSSKQLALINSMTDIILHVRYLAVDGGKSFAADVESLVAAVEENETSSAVTVNKSRRRRQ